MQRGDSIFLVLVVFSVAVLAQLTTNADGTPSTSGHDPTSGFDQNGNTAASHADDTVVRYEAKSDTMVQQKDTSDEQIQQLESSLLNMFGLSRRPRPKGKIHIPQHMIDLYKLQAGITGDLDIDTDRTPLKRYPGNTIRSFYSEDLLEADNQHRNKREATNKPHKTENEPHKVRLYFNVSQIPDHETLKGAEMRLFRRNANASFHNLQTNQDTSKLHSSINKAHRIDIYEIIWPRTATREPITRLLDTRYIKDLNKSKWESFDIHPAVHKWRKQPHLNHGIEAHFTDSKGNSPQHLTHVRMRRSIQNGDDDATWGNEQPVLVAYSDDGKGEYSRRKRRNVEAQENMVEEQPVDEAEMTDEERRKHRREQKRKGREQAGKKRTRKKRQCQRRPLYVDFKDVGWADWIIAPPGYDAYFCHGECPFYLPDHLNATNHAIVQTLVHSVNPQAAPSPCCVPTELSDIAMLYLDEHEKVVLKNYQDMIVEACGCR